MTTRSEIIMRLGGEGGEGVISAGDFFAQGSARTGYHLFTFRTYPAEIKGGHAWYQVRVGPNPVRSMGDGVDVLVAFNAEAYFNHKDTLNPDGVLIYDPDTVTPAGGHKTVYPIPFNKIAKDELNFFRGKNMVVTGAIAGLFGLEPSSLEGLIKQRFHRRPELLEQNLRALYNGYDFARKKLEKQDPFYLGEPATRVARLVLSGNDAIVAGALFAGCRYYAGYPITPASEILEGMAKELPKLGGVSLQAEDEIASIGSVIGASFAGAKAMTATSGPGLALMTEFLGYAGMSETPCVIVDAQRSGPSTGMPTKLEQGDLNHSLYAGHGDFPRAVIAPGSVGDCFFQIINAFNMAERYQLPVIFLSDQSLSHRTEAVTMPDLGKIKVTDRLQPSAADLKNSHFQRYRLTASGISPMSVPGTPGGMYVAPGLEHDELGHVDNPLESHLKMMPKRQAKVEACRQEASRDCCARYGDPDAKIGLIGWGSTEGAIQEAVDRARAAGHKVAALHPKVVYPLPFEEIQRFVDSVSHVIVPEVNFSGQFARYLRTEVDVHPIRVNKYAGLPFMPREIYRKIEEVANHA
ncbi:MAG: 2-oxoacid:acceptor oxidoreductase subunit alpha [Chloroflexi bacterium]|nr:2-oxoacid:acceptor oxidoreductase subunit alpha [Chloroflexota bacterium]